MLTQRLRVAGDQGVALAARGSSTHQKQMSYVGMVYMGKGSLCNVRTSNECVL